AAGDVRHRRIVPGSEFGIQRGFAPRRGIARSALGVDRGSRGREKTARTGLCPNSVAEYYGASEFRGSASPRIGHVNVTGAWPVAGTLTLRVCVVPSAVARTVYSPGGSLARKMGPSGCVVTSALPLWSSMRTSDGTVYWPVFVAIVTRRL